MSKRPSLITVLGAAMLVVLASAAGAAGPAISLEASPFGGLGACSSHAFLLWRACQSDRIDDLFVHVADCIYVTAEEDEKACRGEAAAEAADKREECNDIYDSRREICDLVGEERFDVDLDPDEFVDPNDIGDSVEPNAYWPLTAGHTHVILADEEVTVVTATDEVVEIGGLPCRVIRDLVFEESENDEGEIEYDPAEVTQDWYAQHESGDTIYCGENTYEVVDGLVDNTDGSFAHLTERARAGFLVRAFPVVGEGDRQEIASDEAEDFVEYLSLATSPSEAEGGEAEAYPCGGMCLQTLEINPHDPGEAEHKYYLPGTGFVLATKFEDGEPTGEREEVSCVGASLDVIDDPACGIADPEALRDALCQWAPEAFCED